MDTTMTLYMLMPIALYGLVLVLLVIFVVSHKRLASAHKELAEAHKEMTRQLATIAIELRHKESR